ncbi:hypothetical protein, partial [Profundibacter sp.]
SKIIRTARARTSVEYLFALLLFSIGSIFAYFGASGKQGAVQCSILKWLHSLSGISTFKGTASLTLLQP